MYKRAAAGFVGLLRTGQAVDVLWDIIRLDICMLEKKGKACVYIHAHTICVR